MVGLTRLWFFLAALAPGILVLLIQLVPTFGWIAWSGIVATSLLVILPQMFYGLRRKVNPEPLMPIAVDDVTEQIPIYLITYVFPFVFFDTKSSGYTLVSYAIFGIILFALLFRTELSLVAPTLLVLGYRVYLVKIKSRDQIYLISRNEPIVCSQLCAHHISSNLYLSSKEKEPSS